MKSMFAAVLVVAVAAVALFERPGRFPGPVRQLAEHSVDTSDPVPTARMDVSRLRRAAQLVAGGGTYAVFWPAAERQLGHDLQGAALLLFLPAIPVADPARANWLVLYQVPRPERIRVARVYGLGNGIVVARVRR